MRHDRQPSSCQPTLLTRCVRLTLLLGRVALLSWLSLTAKIKTPAGFLGWDKLNHFAAYASSSLLLIRSLIAWYAPSFDC